MAPLNNEFDFTNAEVSTGVSIMKMIVHKLNGGLRLKTINFLCRLQLLL